MPSISARLVRVRIAVFSLIAFGFLGCGKPTYEVHTLRYSHSWLARPDDIARTVALSQQFAHETGITVENIPTPESTHDYLDLLGRLLPPKPAGTDLLGIDLIWASILAPNLLDLRPYLRSGLPEIAPEFLNAYTVADKLLALPRNVPVGGLEYRADLLREYGFAHPPRTWSELETMALRIQTGERAKGKKDFWGYVWQGAAVEALTCNALEWQASEGGGRIIEKNRTVSVNNPRAIRSWIRASRWIGRISPPSVLAFRERDSMNVFDAGLAAFDRIWLITPAVTAVKDRRIYWRSSHPVVDTGFTDIPGGEVGSVATLGGNGLAVARNCQRIDSSILLLKFLIRNQVIELGRQKTSSNTSESNVDSVAVGNSQGALGIVTRPSVEAGVQYEKLSSVYFNGVHSVLADQQNASSAAADMESKLVQITGYPAGGPEPER